MATYIQGLTDEVTPQKLFRPDYAFLSQAYNTKQNQYYRGFDHVKGIYNQIKNAPLTNGENEEFRNDSLKKLEAGMKSMASLDLSQAGNVSRATALIQPISEDTDFIYDMYATKEINKQKQIMESYRTSADMDKRAMYNQESAINISHSIEDLQNATRGDGSIQEVRPGEFIAFEDINKFLSERAKADGLIMEFDESKNGYILRHTNGTPAIMSFNAWADNQMGDRFNQQLGLKGKVNSESKVRAKMKDEGISRNEALLSFSTEIAPSVKADRTDDQKRIERDIAVIDIDIKNMKKAYGDKGFPADDPELKKQYQELQSQKKIQENNLNQTNGSIKALDEDNEYLIHSMAAESARTEKIKASYGWASNYATSTAKLEKKSDATWVANQSRYLKEKLHNQDFIYKTERDIVNDSFKERELAYKESKLMQDGKSKSSNSSSSSGKDALSFQKTGTYTTKKTRSTVDMMQEAYVNNSNKLYTGITDPKTGLIQYVVDEKDNLDVSHAINKIRSIAQGGRNNLTDLDKQVIIDLGKTIDFEFDFDKIEKNNNYNLLLEGLSAGIYTKSLDALDSYSRTGTIPENIGEDGLLGFTNTLAGLKGIYEKRERLSRTMGEVTKLITDSNGEIKDQYEGAINLGVDENNNIIWDLENIKNEDAKAEVGILTDQSFKNQELPIGSTFYVKNPSISMFQTLRNSNKSVAFDSDGNSVDMEDLFGDIEGISEEAVAKLFGEGMNISIDPVGEMVEMQVKINPKETAIIKAAGISKTGTYTVKLPYSVVQANRSSLPELAKKVDEYTPGSEMEGKMSPFLSNRYAKVESNEYENKIGMHYKMIGQDSETEGYGVNVELDFIDPKTNKKTTLLKFIPVPDRKDPTAYSDISDALDRYVIEYLRRLGSAKTESYKNGSIPFE